MQGLFKSTKKQFLKDKGKFIYNRYRDIRLSEKGKKRAIEIELLRDNIKTETKKEKQVPLPVVVLNLYKTIDLTSFNMSKCDGCQYARRKDEESNGYPSCYAPDTLKRLTDTYGEKDGRVFFANRNFWCASKRDYMFQETHRKTIWGYYSLEDNCYKDYYSNQIITGWSISKNDRVITNRTVFESVTETTITSPYRSWYNREDVFSIHKEKVDHLFFKQFYKDTARRRKCCAKMANKVTRRKEKEWEKEITKDPELLDQKPFPKSHRYEKSIKWCIH